MSSKRECNAAGCFHPVLHRHFHACFGSDEACKTSILGGGVTYIWAPRNREKFKDQHANALSLWTVRTLIPSFPPQPKKWLPSVGLASLTVYMFIFSSVVLDHWCSLSLHNPPPPPHPNPQHGCLLSSFIDGLCPGCYKKKKSKKLKHTEGLTHENNLVGENSREAKVWKQSQHPGRCTASARRDWRGQAPPLGQGGGLRRLGPCGLSPLCGKRLLKQPRRFTVAEFFSSSNCCFRAVLLWYLSASPALPNTSVLKKILLYIMSLLFYFF